MTDETKRELGAWLQYFLIALAAELGAWIALFPNQPGSDINIAGYFELKVEPHLYAWFVIFLVLCAVRITIKSISKRARRTNTPSQPTA
jgi:hypothetical protein